MITLCACTCNPIKNTYLNLKLLHVRIVHWVSYKGNIFHEKSYMCVGCEMIYDVSWEVDIMCDSVQARNHSLITSSELRSHPLMWYFNTMILQVCLKSCLWYAQAINYSHRNAFNTDIHCLVVQFDEFLLKMLRVICSFQTVLCLSYY